MRNFNLQRFARVLRLDFIEGRSQLLWLTLAGLMIYLFFFWFAYNIGMTSVTVDNLVFHVCEGVGAFGCITMFLFFLAVASSLFRKEQKKAKRTTYLTLPATNLEKFLSRWVYMLTLSVVGGFLTFFVADAIHMAWLWLTDKPVIAATTYFLKAFPQTSNSVPHETWLNVLFRYSVLVAAHAFFLLGGILFRKYQTVATALVGSMLFLVFAHFVTHDQPYMRGIPYAWYYSCLSVFLIALTCAFTVLAYRLFCRWQIATYHFVNLP